MIKKNCVICNSPDAKIMLPNGVYCFKHYYVLFEKKFRKALRQSSVDPKGVCRIADDGTFKPHLVVYMLKKVTNGYCKPEISFVHKKCNISCEDMDDLSYGILEEFFKNKDSNLLLANFMPFADVSKTNLDLISKDLNLQGELKKPKDDIYKELVEFEKKYPGTNNSLVKSHIFLHKRNDFE